jgi:hypothetical protein
MHKQGLIGSSQVCEMGGMKSSHLCDMTNKAALTLVGHDK